MTSLETQNKELTKLIKNQEVSAISDQNSFQRRRHDIRGRPNSARFCEYCRMNGHSMSRCLKTSTSQEKRLQKELTTNVDRNVSFETNYQRNLQLNNFSNKKLLTKTIGFGINKTKNQVLAKIDNVWITEEKIANLLGVDFCHLFLKALYLSPRS